ncbi:MAG TPA: AMP-dependent synthetase, partial [Desulfobulbaceae bacterium]|nr:AMP-dependent synthetase [Desulfobulbaceae bacterium]
MGLYDYTFYDLINRNAVMHGDRMCWQEIDDGRTLTFAEYKTRVDLLATGLRQAGIDKGDRIGVLGKNSLEFFLVYGAAAALGAIVLPINWRLSADEVCYNLNDCQPKILFADAEYQEMMDGKRAALPSIAAVYNLKGDLGNAGKFAALLDVADAFAPVEVASTDGFVIIHTAAVAGRL